VSVGTSEIDEVDAARREHYLLLASLLRTPPTAATLAALSGLTGDASGLGMSRISLAEAAGATTEKAAGEEFFNLFIGVGRGEILPYASFYLTGFLNERPLARVREDLARLGIERAPGNFDPEDHLGTLLEVMAGLIAGEYETSAVGERDVFKRHLEPWAARCFADIAAAPSASFYKAVSAVGLQFVEIEKEAFDLT
jgi:TorA maturation chaperone TorD